MLRRKKKIMRYPAPCRNRSITSPFFTRSPSSAPSFTATSSHVQPKHKVFVVRGVPLVGCPPRRLPHLLIPRCRRRRLPCQLLFIILLRLFPLSLRLHHLPVFCLSLFSVSPLSFSCWRYRRYSPYTIRQTKKYRRRVTLHFF